MGASELGIVNGGDLKLERPSVMVQLPDPDKATEKEDQLFHSSLSKQNSILSLTLEEIQFRSGKSFGSMNMDEFLASVWSTEDNQCLSSQTEPNNHEPDSRECPVSTGKSALARQASFSVPTMLCSKTVDEVWYEIHKEDHHHHNHNRQPLGANNSSADKLEPPPHGQQTFGEMTLEDFLVRAGVMQEAQMLCQQKSATVQNQTVGFPNTISPYGSGFANSGPSGKAYQIGRPNSNRDMGEATGEFVHKRRDSLSEAACFKNRIIIDGPPEVVIERRQRRMIKNRESAARSRARKQAYTVELEVELNQLKEENEKLKRTVEEIEQERRKEVLKRKYPVKVEKVKAMRRTLSSAW